MELDEEYIDAHWTKDANGNKQFFIINEAIISKLCILGDEYRPCFEGANITAPKIEFSLEESFKEQLFSMMTEIKNMLNEGGASMVDNTNTPVVEEPVVEPVVDTPVVEEPAAAAQEPVVAEPVVDTEPVQEPAAPAAAPEFADNNDDDEDKKCPECGKPLDECSCDDDEDKPAKYNLEEIPEYIELRNNYSALETQYNELKTENEQLVEFKHGIERKEKEDMIAKFGMLSDEDKQDVRDNIDTYSLDDIEAKLSVICVRNKVSFADLDENKGNEPTIYSLNSGDCSEDDAVPEWVKAIRNNVAKNH